MSDMGDDFREMREETRKHRQKMLAQANTEGWTRHTEYHYSRVIDGKRVEWWPSGGKVKVNGRMIYGHRKVNTMLSKMLNRSNAAHEPPRHKP